MADKITKTQQAINAMGTRQKCADALTRAVGWRISRQAVDKWFQRGALPFQSADTYAGALASAARKKGLAVTKIDLLADVIVPEHRLPKVAIG